MEGDVKMKHRQLHAPRSCRHVISTTTTIALHYYIRHAYDLRLRGYVLLRYRSSMSTLMLEIYQCRQHVSNSNLAIRLDSDWEIRVRNMSSTLVYFQHDHRISLSHIL